MKFRESKINLKKTKESQQLENTGFSVHSLTDKCLCTAENWEVRLKSGPKFSLKARHFF